LCRWIGPFGSGGQLIAADAPADAGLVTAFNTNFARPLLAGQVGGQPLDVFVAGDDEAAQDQVMELIASSGKGHYKFPYGDFANVHRCAVLAAESRAGQRKYQDVELAAARLHGMLDA
jgi:hypothetical protein